ncbi:MAG: hypothetical protein OEY10_00430 [Nitrosopumilus sp.]|nr:hypothetical protein [Nitrosopumilus sp.]
MAILSLANDVLKYLQLSADDSYGNVARAHNAVEAYVKTYCNRNFESASYKEVITDYRGGDIVLKNYPVTAISKMGKGLLDVMYISNSNAYSIATVQVTSTGVTLIYNTTTQTVDFATYTTLTAVVNQINTLGNGWTASLGQSAYGSIISTELVEDFGQSALNGTNVYLGIVETNVFYKLIDSSAVVISGYYDDRYDYDYYSSTAQGNYFRSRVYNNLYVNYTAGYSASTLPNDLKQGMLSLINLWYSRLSSGAVGVKSFSISDYSITYDGTSTSSSGAELPPDIAVVLDLYRNRSL